LFIPGLLSDQAFATSDQLFIFPLIFVRLVRFTAQPAFLKMQFLSPFIALRFALILMILFLHHPLVVLVHYFI